MPRNKQVDLFFSALLIIRGFPRYTKLIAEWSSVGVASNAIEPLKLVREVQITNTAAYTSFIGDRGWF
jgi:hypothetical protein